MYKNYIKLLRLPNLALMALVQVLMQFCVVNPILKNHGAEPVLGMDVFALLLATTVLVAAGGFVINDYYDMKIDEFNRPLTRIVGKEISRKQTMFFYLSLSAVALVAGVGLWFLFGLEVFEAGKAAGGSLFSVMLDTRNYFIVFVVMFGLLWFYSSSYKRLLIVGNLIVSLTVAMVPFVVAMFNVRILTEVYAYSQVVGIVSKEIYWWVSAFSVFLFVWTFIGEVVRNMDEVKGEREMECHTIPVVYGVKVAKMVVCVLALAAIVGCILAFVIYPPYRCDWSLRYFLSTVSPLGLVMAYFVHKAERRTDYKIIRWMLNLIMLSGAFYSVVLFIL
ncbi:MAG: geranylgeranylglycerol-phosphate geranylgeranyltransferase [Paludibacteraceae bacterium]|nr:geranylgeranylglycerol-phosphate geranylgeranyltransferase [Paludibacteraceae bacterium]